MLCLLFLFKFLVSFLVEAPRGKENGLWLTDSKRRGKTWSHVNHGEWGQITIGHVARMIIEKKSAENSFPLLFEGEHISSHCVLMARSVCAECTVVRDGP